MSKKKKKRSKGKKVAGKDNTKHSGNTDGNAVDDATNEQKQAFLDSQMQRLKIAGKGKQQDLAKHAEGDAAAEQKMGALASQMQRLHIEEERQSDDDDALLENAIQLAVAEKREIEEKEKQNCKHGFNPSSRSQERFCVDFARDIFIDYISRRESGGEYEFIYFREAVVEMITKYFGKRNDSNFECIMSYFLSDGTTYLLEGNYELARVVAMAAKYVEGVYNSAVDPAKIMELSAEDKHTLVQFFRKQIPCSCLDQKYEEVKSTPKMGYCCNDNCCPLPNRRAVRSKMVHCTGCRNVNYCSRECQVAAWPMHKGQCGFL